MMPGSHGRSHSHSGLSSVVPVGSRVVYYVFSLVVSSLVLCLFTEPYKDVTLSDSIWI
jgi:hypothetical protein